MIDSASSRVLRRSLVMIAVAMPLLSATARAQHDMSATGDAPGMVIRGFMDVDWLSGGNNTGRKPGFRLGQYDLFVSSRLADRFSFQAETVFEYDEASNAFGVDVERVGISYAATDHLRLSAGKVHTPVGYWNNAYHHGLALQPTIERPMLVRFEDAGGPLPIHTVGMQVSGRDLTPAHLGFDVLLGNGVGNRPVADTNGTPSVTVALHSQLTSSLRVGVSAYEVHSVAGTQTPGGGTLADPNTQTIPGAFVSYFTDRAEAIAEGQEVMNRSLGRTTTSPGWFVYAGYRVAPKFVPYLMHDQLRLAQNDPYFLPSDTRREIMGLRWEETAAVIFKTEARSIDVRGRARGSELAAQIAIAF